MRRAPKVTVASRTGALERSWGPRLLIADDNMELNNLLSSHFRAAGYQELVQAFNGLSALQLARAHQPRVILLDLDLPVLYGQVVVRTLQRDPTTALIKIIVLTGHT